MGGYSTDTSMSDVAAFVSTIAASDEESGDEEGVCISLTH